ncbi:MAG: type II secretion system protein [Candidatus Omnitrophota bacterium]
MQKRAFTLVEVMLVVTIIAALVAIAIPQLLRMRINANDAAAQTTLRAIASACEDYASANHGNYPAEFGALLNSTPAYLNENYTSRSRQGYNFTCSAQMDAVGYNCSATPIECNVTGAKVFTITTGSVLTNTDCAP